MPYYYWLSNVTITYIYIYFGNQKYFIIYYHITADFILTCRVSIKSKALTKSQICIFVELGILVFKCLRVYTIRRQYSYVTICS